ncbi:TetR/AcrR family transcriptional regulator [Rhizobium sp. RU36D]|uniref:TetR/AcrR family transcriptional regulator n=1 Tax=Rhizobium sp. RU36D TaxID=1907415 RepID=UPI0009D8FD46|nr:TetR/AcrR family transcriptional regulator [Rhizobium sp. RU36D]SMC94030.1 transcriptional regulator, TetR family [Rhizobium sp. RU36D]
MKVTREQVTENRRRILDAASRLFRAKGLDSVTVAEVMQSAGLTHGGFYGHFSSKDDLIAQTLAHCLTMGSDKPFDLQAYVAHYLSPEHRDNPADGCPFAALAAYVQRQGADARTAMSEGARTLIGRMTGEQDTPACAEQGPSIIGSWAAMVGAMVLARAFNDPDLSDRILEETRSLVASTLAQPNTEDTALEGV